MRVSFPNQRFASNKKWFVNSGNVELIDSSWEELHKRLVCEYHFTKADYKNSLHRNRLKLFAVPKPHYVNKSRESDLFENNFEISEAAMRTFSRHSDEKKLKSIDEDRESKAS